MQVIRNVHDQPESFRTRPARSKRIQVFLLAVKSLSTGTKWYMHFWTTCFDPFLVRYHCIGPDEKRIETCCPKMHVPLCTC